jgi:hypothetical protein
MPYEDTSIYGGASERIRRTQRGLLTARLKERLPLWSMEGDTGRDALPGARLVDRHWGGRGRLRPSGEGSQATGRHALDPARGPGATPRHGLLYT